MIFQQFNLFTSKNVLKNVEYPLKLAKVPKEQRRRRALEMLEFVGLSNKAEEYTQNLSGGQKQRVAIARALMNNPKILLADEATSALDPETTLSVLRLLKRINVELGTTIVIITHTMSIVELICDRVAVMNRGQIVEIGTSEQVFERPMHRVSRKFSDVQKSMSLGKIKPEGDDVD
jgi:D-methionine transport system ATP-binding protein